MKNQLSFCTTKARSYFINCCLALLISVLAMFPAPSYCQEEGEYDEMIIALSSRIVGNAEVPAIIYNNNAYLPVASLFDFVKLNNAFSPGNDSLYGYILNEKDVFSISKLTNTIRYKGVVTALPEGSVFYKADDYYLEANYFGNIFGLSCIFNFRSLSIDFDTKLDLPFLREQRQQEMRLQLKQVKGEAKPDTVIANKFALLKPGMLDWDFGSNQSKGTTKYSARVGIGIGLLGGEASIYLNYSSSQSMSLKNQQYNWRYVNNNGKIIKQVNAGRVSPLGSLSLYGPLNGVQVSNASSTPKKSFGSFRVNYRTEPNWIVELYINDVMVSYTKADANGLFSFEVPMIYGACNIRYKFYGPFGEIKETTQQINIPYTFLQPGNLEYSLTAGVTGDADRNTFSRLNMNYGLAKRMTIGAAVEYNSQSGINNLMPMLTASLRVGGGMIVSAEHAPGIVSKANANYRFKNNLQVDASYIKYAEMQNVIRTSSLDEKRFSASMPLRFRKLGGFTRITFNDITLLKGRQSFAEWMMAASYKGVNSNIATSTSSLTAIDLQSRLTVSFMAPKRTRLSPQLTYHYQSKKINGWKIEAEKLIGKGSQLRAFYEYTDYAKSGTFALSWQHNLSSFIYGANLSGYKKALNTSQFAGGSLQWQAGAVDISAQKNVGTGGIIIEAFLDANFNGKKDKGELLVKAPQVKIDGRNAAVKGKSMSVTLDALEPFETYTIALDSRNFENPSWKIEHKTYQLTLEPNMYRKISVPVIAAGEVAGYVYAGDSVSKTGMGKIKLHIHDVHQKLVASVYAQPDGFFSYMGLKPGRYSISADENSLQKFQKKDIKQKHVFEIKFSEDGDYVDDLEIILQAK